MLLRKGREKMKARPEDDAPETSKRHSRAHDRAFRRELKRKIDALIEDIDRASRQLDEAQRRIARHRIARY